MTIQVNIHEAKTHLSKLLERVMLGEEVVIAKSGNPVARITAYEKFVKTRVPGTAQGLITIAPDFDAPLPEDILESFEG